MFRKFVSSAAAAALLAAPIAAQAAPARTSSPVAQEEELTGIGFLPIIIGLGLLVVLFLAIDSEDELPHSP